VPEDYEVLDATALAGDWGSSGTGCWPTCRGEPSSVYLVRTASQLLLTVLKLPVSVAVKGREVSSQPMKGIHSAQAFPHSGWHGNSVDSVPPNYYQLRSATLVLGSTILGTIASFISGELLVSLSYLAFDAAQVLIVACASMVLVAAWRWRPTRMWRCTQ
jgi:hypothetical protein